MHKYLYGTAWKEEVTSNSVYNALKAGYRAIDTANQRKHYHEVGVGEALLRTYKELNLNREDLWLQTKFTYQMGQDHRLPYNPEDTYTDQVRSSVTSSLEHLHTHYLDSYILHGPFSSVGITDEDKEVWRQMEMLVKEGLVKEIGVSNVTVGQLKELYAFADIKPTQAQIRTFAQRLWEKETREFCKESGITFQGFSLLTANRQFLGAEYTEVEGQKVPKLKFDGKPGRVMEDLIKQTGKGPAQIIFKFCHQIGILPITGTRTLENMKLNLDIEDFELSDQQIAAIENIALA